MKLEQKFRISILNNLESLNSKFENELREIFESGFSKEVTFLQIEYESQTFERDFSVCLYAVDREGELVGKLYWFLKDIAFVVPDEMYYPEAYSEEEYEDIDPWNVASDILESWLMERWKKVDTKDMSAYLAHHDFHFVKNIENGMTTNWNEIIGQKNG